MSEREEYARRFHAHFCTGSWAEAGRYDCPFDQHGWFWLADQVLTAQSVKLDMPLATQTLVALARFAMALRFDHSLRVIGEAVDAGLVERDASRVGAPTMFRRTPLGEVVAALAPAAAAQL